MKIRTFVSFDYFTCNMYVCSCNGVNFIVDPGYFDDKVKDYIDSIGGISFILITHGHFDHIGGIDLFKQYYKDIKVYAFEDEMEVIYTNRKNVACNCNDRGRDFKSFVPETIIEPLLEGEVVIEGLKINVIHTPGHTQGGAMYFFDDEKVIFMGDTIICDSIGRCDLPTASEKQMKESLLKVKSLGINNDVNCYFGHGSMYSYATLLKKNIFLR